jgi:hypothetical protein
MAEGMSMPALNDSASLVSICGETCVRRCKTDSMEQEGERNFNR